MPFLIKPDGSIVADTADEAVAVSDLMRREPIAYTGASTLELAPIPPVPKPPRVKAAVSATEPKAPRGEGRVAPKNSGWSWWHGKDHGFTFATREEAEENLADFKRTGVRTGRKRKGPDAGGDEPAEPAAVVIAAPTVKAPDVVGEWEPFDAAGLSTHNPCKGARRVYKADRAGVTHHVRCAGCSGEGVRRRPVNKKG